MREGLENLPMREGCRRKAFSTLQRRLRSVLITAFTVLKGQLQKGLMLSLHIQPHREDKWQQLQVALAGFGSW